MYLCVILVLASRYAIDAAMFNRNFKATGITEERLHKEVMQWCGAYAEVYETKTGQPLTSHITMQRWRMKVTYMNGPAGKGGTPTASHEIHTKSSRLRKIYPKVDSAMLTTKMGWSLRFMKQLGAL